MGGWKDFWGLSVWLDGLDEGLAFLGWVVGGGIER